MGQLVAENSLIPAIVTWVEGHASYVTKTKLLKLLYLFDLAYYRSYGRTFTGFSWKFYHLGPWAAEYDICLQGLLAHGVLCEQNSKCSDYDAIFLKSSQKVDTGRAFANAKEEAVLLETLKRWGTMTTGEILNYVYFQTEPMETATRNQPLDFSLATAETAQRYSRPSSGKTPAEIKRLRAKFEQLQSARRSKEGQPFVFTPPK